MDYSMPGFPVLHQLPTWVHSNWCPLSRWCHPTISFSVISFSSCLQSFPASGSFPMSQLFTLGGQRIGVSASTSVLPMNIQDWSPLGWTGWISLQSKGLSKVFSTLQFKSISSLVLSFLYCPTLASIHDYWKNHWWTFVDKVVSLLFNKLSRLVITFLRRSKHLLISWLQSPSAVILEPKKIKSDTVCTVSPSISHEVMGPDAMIFVLWMLNFKPTFSLSSFTFCHKGRAVCLSEVIDVSPSNLDSSLCFSQSSMSHDVLYIEAK